VGALKLQQKRVGTIRRVVRVSGRFVCGLCRNFYDDIIDAHDCLGACWKETLAMDPVVVKRDHGRILHRCLFCARDYNNRSEVLRCAEDCKKLKLRKALAESKCEELKFRSTNRRVPKKLRPVVVSTLPKKRKVNVVTLDPKMAHDLKSVLEDTVPRADANERPIDAGDVAEVLGSEGSGVTGRNKKKKPSAVFYRDQAKYVCTVCHEKYFTKVEVTGCYEGHE